MGFGITCVSSISRVPRPPARITTGVFSGFMIFFAAGAILYDTSNIIHHYNPEQYIAASLSLFASVALLFWYMIQFLMSLSGGD